MTDPSPLGDLVKRASKAAQEKNLDEAASLLDQVLAEDPDHLHALDLFGFVRYFQGRYAEAEQYCRRALAIDANHAYAHKGLGLCIAKQGKVDEGIASLERAIVLSPQWGDPYWDLAVVLTETRRFQEALDVLAQGTAMVPKRAPAFRRFQAQIRQKAQAAR